ncbi:MAG: hypothetical protein PHC66_03935 [Candidatus Nanoarchaeia archaeon]|nr:hypothetical protein [Candidatus Nanoarchaeia archaeon]MDD5239380.1 hypothetical protein [Candidatus Nanoarchaeia archaeon]
MEKSVYIKTAVIALVIFIAGIMMGLWLGQAKVNVLELTTSDLKDSVDNAEFQFALMDILKPEIACNYLISTADELGKTSDELASEVERYESAQKIAESDFVSLKRDYTSTLIRDWVAVEKIKKACEGDYVTILYFYSNENCEDCKDQGIILTYIKDKLDGNVMIFPLDTDLDVSTVNALEESFGVQTYPSLVIENSLYSGYQSLEEVTSALCAYNNNLEICEH